jgi:anti-anti-sigma factor
MDNVVGVDIEQREGGAIVVARLTGELDIAVAEAVGSRIAAAVPSSAQGVVVDMSGLDFMDSSGVSMLFGLARQVGRHRQALHVVAPDGRPVARVLEIVEFGRAAPVHREVAAAVAAIATPREPQPPPG